MSHDPGLQPERTLLAWRRTVLAVAVVAVLTIRLALLRGGIGEWISVVAALGWLATTLASLRHATRRFHQPGTGGATLPLLAAATVGFAGLGAILILGTLG